MGYVDSHPVTTYDSVSQLKKPQAPWMAENLAPDHWERYTQLLRGWQRTFKMELKQLQGHYNHSGGQCGWSPPGQRGPWAGSTREQLPSRTLCGFWQRLDNLVDGV